MAYKIKCKVLFHLNDFPQHGKYIRMKKNTVQRDDC
jgi:hypothetical protein